MFKFEVGKKYKTRDGSWAEILATVPDQSGSPLLGRYPDGTGSLHRSDGGYWPNEYAEWDDTHPLDLMPEEWKGPLDISSPKIDKTVAPGDLDLSFPELPDTK